MVTDDDFDVKLNGTLIGTILGGSNTYTGRLWAPDPSQFDPAKFGPQHPNVFQPTLALDESLLIPGTNTNTLRLTITHVYGSNDFGTVMIGYWKMGETVPDYVNIHVSKFSGNYIDAPGTIGDNMDFVFSYP